MKLERIGSFLLRSKIPVDIEDSKEYKRVTIRINHNGVSLRDKEVGKKIGTKKQFILKSGQFILSKIDARYGAFGIAPNEVEGAIITGNFWAYDVDETKVNIEWFNQFTNSPDFYELCERASSGITHRKYLDEEFFLNHKILLPNIDEQLVQIEKIKEQKLSFGELTTELTHQQDLVKQLRQAFLREAMQGKLVKQEKKDGNAKELLEKVKHEKRKRIADRKLGNEKALSPITDGEIPFDIPKNWVWCKLGMIIELISGQHIETSDYNTNAKGLPYLTGPSDFGNRFPQPSRWTSKPKVLAQKDDILITVKGAGVGKINICNVEKLVISRQLMAIRPINLSRDYIYYFLQNSFDLLQADMRGTGIPGISRENILEKAFPLPPLPEQNRIVKRLDQLMRLCDELEASVASSQEYSEKLLRQILRETLTPAETESVEHSNLYIIDKAKNRMEKIETATFKKLGFREREKFAGMDRK